MSDLLALARAVLVRSGDPDRAVSPFHKLGVETVKRAWPTSPSLPETQEETALKQGNAGTDYITGDGDEAERAAIIEFDGGVPSDWAEGFAMLHARPIPLNVTTATWLDMINAAGRFLDQWGNRAAALGWTVGELFGLDADASINRRDRRGAAFFLIGSEVLALTAEAITIRTGGAVQRIYRRTDIASPSWEARA